MHQTQSNAAAAADALPPLFLFPKYMRRLFMEHRSLSLSLLYSRGPLHKQYSRVTARRLNKSYRCARPTPSCSARVSPRRTGRKCASTTKPHTSGQMKSYFRNMSFPICDVCREIRASSPLSFLSPSLSRPLSLSLSFCLLSCCGKTDERPDAGVS